MVPDPSGPDCEPVVKSTDGPESFGSYAHNSTPYGSVVATKKSRPPTLVSLVGLLAPESGTICATGAVPFGVPSLFQSSVPVEPSSAEKYSVLSRTVRNPGLLQFFPGRMSLTSTVPPEVPSDFHSSYPLLVSRAVK